MQDGSGISLESNVGDVMISNFFDKHSEPPLIQSHCEPLCVEAYPGCIWCQAKLIETFDWSTVHAERFSYFNKDYSMQMHKLMWKSFQNHIVVLKGFIIVIKAKERKVKDSI